MAHDADHRNADFVRRLMAVQPSLRAYLLSVVGDYHLAEDIVQDVAVSAWERYPSYDPARPFLAWVLGIARHKALDVFRRTGRSLPLPADVMESLAQEAPSAAEESSARRQALMHCLKNLTERSRRCVELRFEQDLSVREIAEREATSAAAVQKMLTRARGFLLECTEQALAGGPAR